MTTLFQAITLEQTKHVDVDHLFSWQYNENNQLDEDLLSEQTVEAVIENTEISVNNSNNFGCKFANVKYF